MNKLLLVLVAGLLTGVGLRGQELSVSANMIDCLDRGTMNLEASCGIARHWTVSAGVKYNPFTFGKGDESRQDRQRLASAGARWWPWHVYSGWWLGAKLQYQEYNSGGFRSPTTSEGDRYGGGVSAGYTYMISPHFNLDFGLGMWSGYDRYTAYACPRCGRIVESGAKMFVLPNDLLLSVTYLF